VILESATRVSKSWHMVPRSFQKTDRRERRFRCVLRNALELLRNALELLRNALELLRNALELLRNALGLLAKTVREDVGVLQLEAGADRLSGERADAGGALPGDRLTTRTLPPSCVTK